MGTAKQYIQSHCDYISLGLDHIVIPALESVQMDTSGSSSESAVNTCKPIEVADQELLMLKPKLNSTSPKYVYSGRVD